MSLVEQRLTELGFQLPDVPKPVATFENVVRTGKEILINNYLS